MKTSELRTKTKEELTILLEEKRKRVDELYQFLHSKKVKNVKELGLLKKDIARILTLARDVKNNA